MTSKAVILEHLPMVKSMAVRLAQAQSIHVDAGDLAGAGLIGLMRATRNFKRSRGVPFGSYAKHRIRGEMLDFIAREVHHVHEDLVEDHNEHPFKITGELGRPDPCPRAPKDAGRLVALALRDLAPKARGVIVMRFIDEMSHKAVARKLAVGDTRIWQIQREALAHMRRTLRLYQVREFGDIL